MTATNHGLFGAVIAISLQKYPAVAIALAPFSHFLLDAIPHFGDMNTKGSKFVKVLIIDATLAVITTLLIAWAWHAIALLVIACAFLAASPDLMWIYYEYMRPDLKYKHLVPKFHSWIQWSQTAEGIKVEIIWYMILFSTLLYLGLN